MAPNGAIASAAVRLVFIVDVPFLLLGLGCRQQGRAERDGAALNPEDAIALLRDDPSSLRVVVPCTVGGP